MLEIIGEAAYKLTNEFKEDNPDLPWRKMVGMRHVLVHGYNNVSPEVLWEVIPFNVGVISERYRLWYAAKVRAPVG